MATAPGMSPPKDWESIARGMRVVRLTVPLRILVPALAFPALSKSARGLTLYPGRAGVALGGVLLAASAVVGYMLLSPAGVLGPVLSAWTLGTAGGAILAAALKPTAFIKPLCVACRLLPVIKEHEAIHLSGVASEQSVWGSMKTRHTVMSLSLEGDPKVCSFCPIPKRLSEH